MHKPKNDNDKKTKIVDKTKTYVFVYANDRVELREVEIGIQDTEYYQIKSGLEIDEEVVIAPYRAISKKLKNKQPVEKVEKSKLFGGK